MNILITLFLQENIPVHKYKLLFRNCRVKVQNRILWLPALLVIHNYFLPNIKLILIKTFETFFYFRIHY